MYPPANGVRDNGELLPSWVPVLAEHLHAHEFDTAALVGAFVLDRRFGLTRGFHEYWGEFPLYRYGGLDPTTFQFRGEYVEQAAAEWIFFLPERWRQILGGSLTLWSPVTLA